MNEYEMPDGNFYEFASDEEALQARQAWEKQFQQEKPEAPSGFVKGLTDPFTGTAQLLGKGLQAVGVPYGETLANYYADVEKQYESDRAAAGEEGFDWARLGGNLLSPGNIAVAGRIGQISSLPKVAKATAAGGIAGAMSPVSDDENFAKEKATQVGLGVALAPVGEYAVTGVGRMVSPRIGKEEALIRELGVTPTPGQSFGGQPKALEEFAENLPIVGSSIKSAKDRNIVKFNQGVINQKLSVVGAKLPEDLVGNEAVDFAYKVKDSKYAEVLKDIDLPFSIKDKAKLKTVINNSTFYEKAEADKAQKIFDVLVSNKIPQGSRNIDGDLYKSIDSELNSEIFALKQSGDASSRRIGLALEKAHKEFRELLTKQFPEKSSALRRVDKLDRELRIVRTASGASGSDKGVFTPKIYSSAVRQQDRTRGKSSFGRGKATGQDVAQAGLDVLGGEADAILQGRLATQSVGGLAAGGIMVTTNPALAGAVAGAIKFGYSPTALRVLDAMISKRPAFAKTLGDIVQKNADGFGGLTAQEIIEAYNKAENQ